MPTRSPINRSAPIRKRNVGSASEVPPFSIAGYVDGTGESPGYPMSTTQTISYCVVEIGSAPGDTGVDFDIMVNGSAVSSHSVSAAGTTIFSEALALVANDIVSAAITSAGSGAIHNLLIVLRQ